MSSVFVQINNARMYHSRNSFLKDFFRGKKLLTLDVGNLGDGNEHVKLKSIVESQGGEYFGLDVNANLAKKLSLQNQFIGDLHDLEGVIQDARFDCIYGGQIIEHSWMPNLMIKECHRILKDDGFLVLDTPNAFDIINIIRVFLLRKDTIGFSLHLTYNKAKDNFKTYREDQAQLTSQPQHKIFYGPAMLRQLLTMHGFSVEYFAYILKPRNLFHGAFLFFFPQAAQKIAVVARKDSLENIFSQNQNV